MGTLNPDLLSKDLDSVMNRAVSIKDKHRHAQLMPEVILLALLEEKGTAAEQLLTKFVQERGVELERLIRKVALSIDTRRDQNGNLDFVARENRLVPMSRQTIIMVDDALSLANSKDEVRVDTDHLLSVMAESHISTSGLLREFGITPKSITDLLTDSSQIMRRSGTTKDYVAGAKAGQIKAVYFREDLLREIINIVTQSVNRHVILIGQDGVGKRTLAYSLALLMSEGKGPVGLNSLVQVDETALLDSDHKAVRAGLNQAHGGIFFIPHLHRFFGGPARAEFTKATPLIQKAFLDDNPVIIATSTEQDYNERLAKVSAIVEHAQVLHVDEPTVDETIEILKIMKPHLEADYRIRVEESALVLSTRLAKRYLSTMPLPRSAEHLVHRTAAMISMSQQSHLAFRPSVNNSETMDAEDVTLTISQMTGIPVNKLGEDERLKYASMVEYLQERVIGQNEAVLAISRAIKTARVGLKDAKRPVGAFLFLGPTGVGKSELSKVLAEFMFGSEDAMLPLDMSEFQDESSLNRLIGSPSGYVDSEAGGQLTERVRKQPYSIVLFDEVEKAHPRILDILLQVIDEGRLTDGRGNTTRFSETVIILTSNLGARQLAVPVVSEEVREQAMVEVREFFRPEFINRLDEVIMFNALDNDSLYQILGLLLKQEAKMAGDRGLALTFDDSAKQWMLSQNNEPEYGARPLRRIIRRTVREPLADFLLKANPPAATEVKVLYQTNHHGLTFEAVVNGQTIQVGE